LLSRRKPSARKTLQNFHTSESQNEATYRLLKESIYSAGMYAFTRQGESNMPNTSNTERTNQSGQQSGQNVNQGNKSGNNPPNKDNMKTGQQSNPGSGKH
jgi:hypothetical protein